MNQERLLTVKELAARTGLSTRTIWNFRDMGRMPKAIKLNGSVRWREADINGWIAAGCPDCRTLGKSGQRGARP